MSVNYLGGIITGVLIVLIWEIGVDILEVWIKKFARRTNGKRQKKLT